MFKRVFIIFLFLLQEVNLMNAAELIVGKENEFFKFNEGKRHIYLTEPGQVKFMKEKDTYVWVSDIEHVIEKNTQEIFLADGEKKFYLAGDKIPAGKKFELFPYHFYYKTEEEKLKKKVNYKLIMKNISKEETEVEIFGIGTTTDWDHYKTWEGAFKGNKKGIIKLKPSETYTLWEEKSLVGDLPWSGIVLGKTNGDIWVCDYCYLGDEDPGTDNAEQIPDLTYEPYLLASFTRGTAPWNAASIDYFPHLRDENNILKLSKINDSIYSTAIAFSPGGPYNKLCNYNAVEPTFREDKLLVMDPVSKKEHVFFGGNYPIMYKYNIPVINDTTGTKTLSFYISSNDKFKVDTIVGVWINGKMLACRVPIVSLNSNWKVLNLSLEAGEKETLDFVVVPLGSRWGGMVTSLEISSGK